MNRAEHRVEKICDVVYEPKQFEYITLMTKGKLREPTKKELFENELIAIKIMNKNVVNPVANSKWFHDTRITNPWGKQKVAIVGNMIFY